MVKWYARLKASGLKRELCYVLLAQEYTKLFMAEAGLATNVSPLHGLLRVRVLWTCSILHRSVALDFA